MARMLELGWWALLVRGVAAVIFGLLLLFAPGITLAAGGLSLVLLFSIYAIINGGSIIAASVRKREGQWLLWAILGAISIAAGIITLLQPMLSTVITIGIMMNILGIYAILNGVMEIAVAWRIRHEIDDEWFMILSGALGVLFGVLVLVRPLAALEGLLLVTAFYALFYGGLQIALAVRARSWVNRAKDRLPSAY